MTGGRFQVLGDFSATALLCCRREHLLNVNWKVLMERQEVSYKPGAPGVLGSGSKEEGNQYLLDAYCMPGTERGAFPTLPYSVLRVLL